MTAEDLDDLASRFATCTLPKPEWTHAAHLAVGLWHVNRYGADAALERLRDGIRRLNESHGTINSSTGGYHETVTRAYVQLLAAFTAQHPGVPVAEQLRRLLAGPLADRAALLSFYSRGCLESAAARLGWLEPDVAPLALSENNGGLTLKRQDPMTAALEIVAERFAGATATFLAGSVVRGDATETSDLDLVVVYERLDAAYRESFLHRGWPVEVFVHDPATLRYFFKTDRARGVPTLADMVANGVPLPKPSDAASSFQTLAAEIIATGPMRLSEQQLAASRYAITNLVDDLRSPRSNTEALATATALYSALSEHFLRAQGLWSATAKAIPRRLHAVEPSIAQRFTGAFAQLFETGHAESVIALAEELLRPSGGWLFAGYKATAPSEWRLTRQPEPEDEAPRRP